MIYLNPHQPRRPIRHPQSNERLLFRTYPILGHKIYKTTEPLNRITQMILYRWSRSDEFVNSPSCDDLYNYLITDKDQELISKRRFGTTIINAVDYECRKLKGKTVDNDKMRQIYYFLHREELQYGLEYMICAWLRKFLEQESAPGETVDDMETELDILVNSDESEFINLYKEPSLTKDAYRFAEPDWRQILRRGGETIEDEAAPKTQKNDLKSYY